MNESCKGQDRTAQVFREGAWIDIPFREIEKGDTFRLFERDGSPVEGATACLAMDDPKPTPANEKVWGIEAHPIAGGTEGKPDDV